MDATTLGSVLALVGVLSGAVVAYLGKRGETAVTGYSSLTDQLQEERADQRAQIADLRQQLTDRDARLAEQCALRAADQAEITRLRNLIQPPGGHP
jgi:hypothetical protein